MSKVYSENHLPSSSSSVASHSMNQQTELLSPSLMKMSTVCGERLPGMSHQHDSSIDYTFDEQISIGDKYLNRVHEELEKLNIATDVINKLELQLDTAREAFAGKQRTWSKKLNELSRKFGSAIEIGRPYYEAKLQEKKLRDSAQNATIRYECATSLHAVAKQQVKLTLDSLSRQKHVQPECLEVLNHHIKRVNETEAERLEAENSHRAISEHMIECARLIAEIEKANSRAIKKSRHYFEQRIEFTRILEQQKALIMKLEAEVRQKKRDYTVSLRNLEKISDSIHEERSLNSLYSKKNDRDSDSEDVHTKESQRKGNEIMCNSGVKEQKILNRLKSVDEVPQLVTYDHIDLPVLDGNSAPHLNSAIDLGIILLAQQLIGSTEKNQRRGKASTLPASLSQISPEIYDVRYHTTLPQCSKRIHSTSSEESSDSEGSYASCHTDANTINTDELNAMLRSHSQLIEEIDECAEKTKTMLHGSLNNLVLDFDD